MLTTCHRCVNHSQVAPKISRPLLILPLGLSQVLPTPRQASCPYTAGHFSSSTQSFNWLMLMVQRDRIPEVKHEARSHRRRPHHHGNRHDPRHSAVMSCLGDAPGNELFEQLGNHHLDAPLKQWRRNLFEGLKRCPLRHLDRNNNARLLLRDPGAAGV